MMKTMVDVKQNNEVNDITEIFTALTADLFLQFSEN